MLASICRYRLWKDCTSSGISSVRASTSTSTTPSRVSRKLSRWSALPEGCFLALANSRPSRFSSPAMGTLRNNARMPPAKMGSTRSTSCAAKAKTSESRSSATKSVTPTTVTSRACFVFDLIQMFLSRSVSEVFSLYCIQKKSACQAAGARRSTRFTAAPGASGLNRPDTMRWPCRPQCPAPPERSAPQNARRRAGRWRRRRSCSNIGCCRG